MVAETGTTRQFDLKAGAGHGDFGDGAVSQVMAWEVQSDLRWELQNLCTKLGLGSMLRQLAIPKVLAGAGSFDPFMSPTLIPTSIVNNMSPMTNFSIPTTRTYGASADGMNYGMGWLCCNPIGFLRCSQSIQAFPARMFDCGLSAPLDDIISTSSSITRSLGKKGHQDVLG